MARRVPGRPAEIGMPTPGNSTASRKGRTGSVTVPSGTVASMELLEDVWGVFGVGSLIVPSPTCTRRAVFRPCRRGVQPGAGGYSSGVRSQDPYIGLGSRTKRPANSSKPPGACRTSWVSSGKS